MLTMRAKFNKRILGEKVIKQPHVIFKIHFAENIGRVKVSNTKVL